MAAGRGRYSRGYLPHIDVGSHPQFLTWRLADSVPHPLIEKWKIRLMELPEGERRKHLASRIERYCDLGHGSCILGKPSVARIVQEKLFFDNGRRYTLHAWAVMPNHVHALLTPLEGISLEEILKTMKGVSAREINRHLHIEGRLWEPDYFDRVIRNEAHFERVRRYIEWNPVKAVLCQDPSLYSWSSANPDARKREELVRSADKSVRESVAD